MMKKNIIYSIAFLVTFFVLLFSEPMKSIWFNIFPRGNEFGMPFNPERLKRGILVIPETWSTQDNGKYTKTWRPSRGELFRTSKLVVASEDGIDSEVDYLSNKDQSIEMIYKYKDSSNKWEITWSMNTVRKAITKTEADSILLKWGINP